MLTRRSLAGLAALLPAASCSVARVPPHGIHAPDASTLAAVPEWLRLSRTPGLGLAYFDDTQRMEHHAGVLHARESERVGPQTLWVAASLSKQAVAYAALRLAGAGRLDLDSPVGQLVETPGLARADAANITPRQLLSHTSGLPNWRSAPDLKPSFAPGSDVQYSGEGYFLLGRCLEAVTGLGFESCMQAHVFRPLGMASSTFTWLADAGDRLVSGHRNGEPWTNRDAAETIHRHMAGSTLPPASWTLARISQLRSADGTPALPSDLLYPNPAYSMLTTVSDYVRLATRFVARYDDGLDLSPALLREVGRRQGRVNARLDWGLGVGIESTGGARFLWQWGNNAGAWTNLMLLDPRSARGLVVFTNGSNGLRVAERIVDACTGMRHPLFLWI